MRVSAQFALALGAALALAAPARADDAAVPTAPGGAAPAAGDQAADQAAEPGFWERPNLFGNMAGLRDVLSSVGLTFNLQETGEVFGNTSGGLHQSTTYDGQTLMSLSLDTSKALGWEGGTIYVSALQIHGSGPTPNLTGSLLTVSNIEADRATRLYDAYIEQDFGRVNIRAGQFGADEEFMVSQYLPSGSGDATTAYANAVTTFINSTFGYPGIPSLDQPGGGPAYPLATPGVRLRVKATDELGFQFAVFNGNPGGPGDNPADPQKRNPSGVSGWQMCCGVLGFAEAQYGINQGKDDPGLVGTYRLGAWFHTASFNDQRYNTAGALLADPAYDGLGPKQRWTDYSFYVGGDQMVYQTGTTKAQGIGVFGRVMASPNDRNLISFYANAGMTWKGPIPGRDDDSFGLGVAYAHIGARARRYDTDVNYYAGTAFPQRDYEAVLEATYQIQLAGWWQLQPDFQYIIHPGGGVGSPTVPTQRVPNAVLLGLRTQIVF